jgi:4-hydroxybutyrate dehydrogenase
MQQFNYPTVLLYGEGSLEEACKRLPQLGFKKPLIVTDKTLVEIGLVSQVVEKIKGVGIEPVVFDGTHPNPIEQDCEQGAEIFNRHSCDSVIAIGGGSPMDAAKGIMLFATHEGPMSKYDDAKGGDKYITNKLPPLIAIPTTAGTGSEVGRAGVIITKDTHLKTIVFHPTMMPILSVLEPTLTTGLPRPITVATGLDAFTHSLEAYFSPVFHPMADGIAVEGMKLVLDNLKTVADDGSHIEARSKMLLAASMGATAFQKGLGMIHAIAHPLGSECGMHHGLANAVLLPHCVRFLENSGALNQEQKQRLDFVNQLFAERGLAKQTLSESCKSYFSGLGIEFGLKNHGVRENQVEALAEKAFLDVSHKTNMIPVTTGDLKAVIKEAM